MLQRQMLWCGWTVSNVFVVAGGDGWARKHCQSYVGSEDGVSLVVLVEPQRNMSVYASTRKIVPLTDGRYGGESR